MQHDTIASIGTDRLFVGRHPVPALVLQRMFADNRRRIDRVGAGPLPDQSAAENEARHGSRLI
ncbi:MAG TPA: hypothetical protein VK749_22630, partial [Xanthobacteraceae bacterium]|nr:hypothetical protein [Xanthobacteraceae bacterium]